MFGFCLSRRSRFRSFPELTVDVQLALHRDYRLGRGISAAHAVSREALRSAFGVRGFSFTFARPHWNRSWPLSKDVNLAFALLHDARLAYPKRVRKSLAQYLCEVPVYHVRRGIGWALGRETTSREGRKEWCIFNLQTDLVRAPSCLRQHFDGWHRILFTLIVREAARQGVETLFVPPARRLAASVLGCAERCPEAWLRYYDRNALRLGFSLEKRGAANVDLAMASRGFVRATYVGRISDVLPHLAPVADLFENRKTSAMLHSAAAGGIVVVSTVAAGSASYTDGQW